MTVNERLFALNLMDSFDEACDEDDADKIRQIVRRLNIDKESIELIIKKK